MTDDRDPAGQEVLGHLQEAALELVAATRSALDLLEAALRQPEGLGPLVGMMRNAMSAMADAVRSSEASTTSPAAPADGPDATRRAGVQHIPVR
jgi:hypothetical protein